MRTLYVWYLISVFSLLPSAFGSVLAIDYGTDWIKASLMKPGLPFDVLLNKDSKRKIQSVVAWKNNDRLFSTDAFNLASRFPSDSFSSLKFLQAVPFQSDVVSYYTTISSADLVETSRRTVALRQSDGTEWSVEELIAMQFSYIKSLAETLGEEKVSDVIVTVPPYYTQFERDAVADAIEISGLRTLALINDGTAVAVNYAMTRTFPKQEYHIIYDAGASSVRATVVSFSTDSSSKSDTPATHIVVAGVGYDRTIGGTELDRRLRELLVDEFVNKHKKDIRQDKRGMAKLWKEASRVKAILSANTEAVASVESVAFDIDFRTKVTRASFETACADLKGKYIQPIHDALANAGLSLNDITSVILTGGSTRTPMIQAAVKAAVGDDKIALNVNADEAAVLGAGLHGASLSRQFKTKNIKVQDIGLNDIQASYFSAPASSNAKPRSISTTIFPAGSKTGSKKTLNLKRKEDFDIFLDYKTQLVPGFPNRILEVEVSGVADAIGNLTERGAIDPVVKATLMLSESGFVSVTEAVAFGEIKDESIAGKLKGLFGGGSSSSSSDDEKKTEDAADASSASDAAPSASASSEAKAEKVDLKDLTTIPLNLTVHFTSIPPMTVEEKRVARRRLRELDMDEAAKNRKEEARNTLESYLYKLRDLLDPENRDTPFKECSQESERAAIAEKLQETITWLHDKGDVSETSQFLDKRIALETLERPIMHRYTEIANFPQALNNSQMWNWSTRLFLAEARQNLTREAEEDLPSKWTKEELDALEKTLKEHETWLNTWVEKQKSVKLNQDPVIETTEMKARAKMLEQHLQKLWKRKVSKPRKTVTPTAEKVEATVKEEVKDEETIPRTDEQQAPLQAPEEIRDEL
ncbi:actin-like ATPase domain-containing protein [Guyanagaster necrorhizus]|uniref:Actin-like ATPase domain-containing protein n=1 Tax=Guyanagaster necrorhizus TaxID=856835 RepID=A0A9P8ATU7_9AGAR|nr:actin-like ATPase domain-containing protein [Guyanagaster necrorhizus MCA 3950]KAG7447381.1 actin-like ATPase domain-containing protein [Guyanagaster necrorhizus MCA 3950]